MKHYFYSITTTLLLLYGLLSITTPEPPHQQNNFSIQNVDTIFYDGFEAGVLDEVFWSTSSSTTEGLIEVNQGESVHTGEYGLALGKTSDAGGFNINTLDLHLDLAGEEAVYLSYWISDYWEDNHPEDGIWLSNDGGETFYKAYGFNCANWNNFYGQLPPFNISKAASSLGLSLTSEFVIRFQQADGGDFNTSNEEDGIFLDNISVFSAPKSYASLPYETGFEEGELDTYWRWAFPAQTSSLSWITPQGVLDVVDWPSASAAGSYGLAMGRVNDGSTHLNAADLHLDLSGYAEVSLEFELSDYFSENDDYSGIWLSDDGGETFELAMRFKPESYPNNDFISFDVDIDSLAYEQSLNLTSTFVVRFQQRGNADFNTSNDEDGLFLDEVKVSGELLSPQAPLITSFSPMSGYPGEEVVILGENFTPASVVRFNQLLSPSITYINSGELRAIVPQLASTGKIGVETEFGSALSEEVFTVLGSGVIFFEDWETGTIRPMWTTNSSIAEGLITVGEVIGSSAAASGFYGVALGKSSDGGGFNINQLDLHLPMEAFQGKNVLLSYDIKGFYEDTHPEDGIYISNDGGASFEKIYDFNFDSWSNLLYGKLPPLELGRISEELGIALTDDYVIRFQQADFGDFSTSNDEDGIFLDNILIEERSVVYAQLPFTEGFETGSLNNAWTWAMPTATSPDSWIRPGGLLGITGWEVATQSGNYGLRMGRRSDGNITTNALDLHLDLAGEEAVYLSYWISDYWEDNHPEDGIWLSNDGGETFYKAYGFNCANWNNFYGQLPPFNISKAASSLGLSLTSEFVIRFQQADGGDFNTSNEEDGIFLDNISVFSAPKSYASLPYETGFEEGELDTYWRWAFPAQTSSLSWITPQGVLDVVDWPSASAAGSYGLAMGRVNDGSTHLNAADLHLDLSGYAEVSLEFELSDYFSENDDYSGIWLSDDGGETFELAMRFKPESYPNNDFISFDVDIDSLAYEQSLNLTSTFVVRFQQRGNADFNTSNDEDGLFLDEVKVSGELLSPQAPLITSFSPMSGYPGEEVVILGENFTPASVVRFNQLLSPSITYINSGELRAIVPQLASTGKIGVETEFGSALSEEVFTVLGSGVIFFEDWETGTIRPMWTTNSSIAEGLITVGEVIGSSAAASGFYGVALGKSSDGGGFNINQLDLHLPMEAFQGKNVLLSYDIKGFYEDTHPEDGIYISNDGGASFEKIYDFTYGSSWSNSLYGKLPPLELGRISEELGIALTDDYVIRFQQADFGDFSTSNDEDGIFLDNILIEERSVVYAQLPFTEGFETGSLNNAWTWAMPTATSPDSWIRPGGLLGITGWEVATQSGNYGLRMGRRSDGNITTNAIDLRLHLQGYSEVVLNFGLSDFYDESQAEEGIYFSNDGGETFTSQPVFLFNTASQPNEVYQNFTLNLDSLALANDLPYTDEFVIRFQQVDNADFSFSNDEDGIFIDNIAVTGNITNGQPQITYLSPSIGPIGIEVDIVGINLQGTNGVTFNGVSAIDYEEESNQKIKAIVPNGTTTGKVRITTPIGEAVSPYDFQVVEGNDLGIKTILAPQSGCELGEEEVVIELQNYGALPINEQIELSYSVEGQSPVTENTSIVLEPGATLTYTFTETTNLSLLQEFTLTVTLEYAGDGNAENDMLTANIENYDNPTASINGGGFICVGDNIQLSAEGGGNYLWNTGATTSSINVSPSTTTAYTVTVTDENACFDIASTTVEVGSPEVPEILLPQGNVLCPGGMLVLQSSIAQDVIWSTDEFGSQIEVNSPGEYFVTYVDPNTDCAVASEPVNIIQAPVLSISGEISPICEGESVSLYVTGAATLLWSTDAATGTITITPTVASSYSVTATDANGCTFTDEVFIDVIPDEPIGVVGNLLPVDGTFNIPPTTQLSWSPAANATLYDLYLWEDGAPEPTQPYDDNISQINITVFGLSVGTTYNWYILPKNECQEGSPSPTQSFTVAERPDLIVENIDVPSSANSGTEIEVRWDVRNIGNQSTEDDNWLDFAFLSTDQSLSVTDQFLGSVIRPVSLDAGQAYEAVLSYQLPPCIDGDYYVIVVADGYNTLAEMLENNNSEASTVSIPIALSPRADLKVISITPPGVAGILQEGESYEISWTVENAGDDTTRTSGWYDRVFINTEPFDNPQTRIPLQPNSWVYQNEALAPEEFYNETLSFTLPAGLEDTVYFYVLTDFSDQEEECLFEENNRDRTDALWINPDPKPDFRLNSIQIPLQASNREAVELYWELSNVGAPYNGTLQARVYLSDQPAFTGSGFITSFNINDDFINGQIISGEQTITIPDYITGDHYLTVLINPGNQIDEGSFFDEENRKTKPIHVLTPNLVADSIVPASSTVVAGENLEVSWYLHNSGPGSLVNRTVTDYINLPGVFTASSGALTLASGQSTTRNESFTIPLMTSPGNYTLQLQTNGNLGVYEAGQTQDNTVQSASTVMVVAPERPDLIGDSIQPDEDNYFIGDEVEITYSVSNIGEVATTDNWKAGIYMSTSPIFNPFSNLAFGPRNIAQSIAVGEAFSESFTVSIPAYVNPGTYYLHLVADVTDAVFELSEENNTIASIPFTIQALPPESIVDMSLTNVVASDNITAGTPVQLSWRTTNIGNTATIAGQWIDRLYVAESPTFEVNQSIEVASWQRSGGLAPEQFYTKLESFVLPNNLPEGEVYLFLVTDAEETTLDDDRANNVVPIVAGDDDEPVIVDIPPKPDLTVTIENAPQAAVAGQPIEVTFTVTNNATGATTNAWLDRVLLSNDEQTSASDVIIGQSTNVQSLAPEESYQDTISGFIPISASGNFFLLVNTDGSHLVTENNESNNTESAYINIVSPPPGDIVVQQVSTIPEAMSNDTIMVDWVLKNIGENPIAGYMEQVVYLSQDTSWSADDVELARWQGNANIGQEQEATFTQELCLTDVQDGDYHFIIRADALNNIIEVDDTNNDGYNANPISINVPDLYVDIVENTTLPLEKPVYYRFVVDEELAGETVSISLTSNEQNAVNEMYVRYEAVPNRTVFDLVYDVPFEENQQIIISDLVVGTYYIMAYSVLGNPSQDVELLAEIVPFEITSINTDVGGNTGLVTTEVTGTRFAEGMQVRLENGGDSIFAQQVNVVSELRAFVTFNLLGQPLDTFDVVAISNDETDESVLIDGFVIAEGIMPTGGLSYSCDVDGASPLFFTVGDDIDSGNPLELEKIHPATARPNQLITITFRYENTGNIDVELPQLLISSLGGAPLSIDPEIFEEDILEIGMEFQEEDGPPNILRPGGEAVFTVYTRAIAELRFRLF